MSAKRRLDGASPLSLLPRLRAHGQTRALLCSDPEVWEFDLALRSYSMLTPHCSAGAKQGVLITGWRYARRVCPVKCQALGLVPRTVTHWGGPELASLADVCARTSAWARFKHRNSSQPRQNNTFRATGTQTPRPRHQGKKRNKSRPFPPKSTLEASSDRTIRPIQTSKSAPDATPHRFRPT
ncbi:uncharacterized protein B0I36DRAFT_28896 [Microdochium trichocladiopsis]|uniref:Uncharacterized protein n=1 Tax=Microdochium trichocladiopsis TaxID=1682393 RepID=A0A9P8XVT1_9PEZI|nr:uncharacterized protein B0I36DRAFT_28896 [Microdochium trichocladiopsis]KAH7021095.1 hypothetical protein B0I36DRAFT_28896 [Microdochium trichocladiopsis]